MLDKNTLEWLEIREKNNVYGGYYCRHCRYFDNCFSPINCKVFMPDYKDAAEFEAYYNLILATDSSVEYDACIEYRSKCMNNCDACKSKYVRIRAEWELDNGHGY